MSLENGPFGEHKWLKSGSRHNQKFHFFHARVGLEIVTCGLHKWYCLFGMAQCGSQGCASLVLPFLLINILVFRFRFNGIPLTNVCQSPNVSCPLYSVCLSTSPQSNSKHQSLKLPMTVHFTTMHIKPHPNCIACTNLLALSSIACVPLFPTRNANRCSIRRVPFRGATRWSILR